jgi:hypothetical protein
MGRRYGSGTTNFRGATSPPKVSCTFRRTAAPQHPTSTSTVPSSHRVDHSAGRRPVREACRLELIYREHKGLKYGCASCAGSGVWHNWHNGRSNGGQARAVERVPPQTASYACAWETAHAGPGWGQPSRPGLLRISGTPNRGVELARSPAPIVRAAPAATGHAPSATIDPATHHVC